MRTAGLTLLTLGSLALAVADPHPRLEIVSRAEWQAKSPAEKPEIQILPLKLVIIHDTKTAECTTLSECAAVVRDIQSDHMTAEQWDDIGYNFLVGGDGRVYEGRSWDSVGAHTLSWNRRSLGVALIGNFTEAAAPDRQAAAALELVRVGVELKKLSAGHRVAAACQLRPYDSPGLAQFERVRVWDRWWPWSTTDAYCRVGGKSKHKKVALPEGLPAWLSGVFPEGLPAGLLVEPAEGSATPPTSER